MVYGGHIIGGLIPGRFIDRQGPPFTRKNPFIVEITIPMDDSVARVVNEHLLSIGIIPS